MGDPKWVLRSLDHGGFLPEEPYEMAAEFPAARRARELRAAEEEGEEEDAAAETLAPLHGLSIFVAPNGDGEQRDTLRALAAAAGAKVAATLRGADMCVAMPGARVAASRRGRAAPASRRCGCTIALRRSARAPWRAFRRRETEKLTGN